MQSLAGRNIKQRVEGIKPSAIYAYTDKVVAWVADPLSKDEISLLNQFGRVVAHERSQVRTANYFDKSYRQRLQIFQTSPLVLHLINERCPGATLSYTVNVQNKDSQSCSSSSFSLTGTVPSGWGKSLSVSQLKSLPPRGTRANRRTPNGQVSSHRRDARRRSIGELTDGTA